jgi:phosphatidylglycerol:prolipoprotein diacylglycerol transferase
MIILPEMNPEIFHVTIFDFVIAPRWYGLAYVVGLIFAWWYCVKLCSQKFLWKNDIPALEKENIESLIFYAAIGCLAGGRLGYVLFYNLDYYSTHVLDLFKIWQGGMSFHGGILGVFVAIVVYSLRYKVQLLSLMDIGCVVASGGLFFGRLANFVNGELWGRQTSVSWGMVFPEDPLQISRHPSQLYEALGEGIFLGIILSSAVWFFSSLKRPGMTSSIFIFGYGVVRFYIEFFREPDQHLGFIVRFSDIIALSMGQILCVPMIIAGVALFKRSRRGGADL